jgi:hypothetical protein
MIADFHGNLIQSGACFKKEHCVAVECIADVSGDHYCRHVQFTKANNAKKRTSNGAYFYGSETKEVMMCWVCTLAET